MACRDVCLTFVVELLDVRIANHSTVAVQELMHTVGVLDPADARTKNVINQIGVLIDGMPEHRTFAPDADVLRGAALLSVILCRLQGYQKDARLRALQDCVLLLQAQKLGLTALTANVVDFDYLLQLIPAGRALLYRRSERRSEPVPTVFNTATAMNRGPMQAAWRGLPLRTAT